MSLNIRMDDNGAQVSIDKNGTTHAKNVDFGELLAIMQSHAVYDFGLLPPNTRYLSTSGNNFTIAVEVPPGNRNLQVGPDHEVKKQTIEKVSLPAAIVIFQLIRRDGGYAPNSVYMYAIEGDRLLFSTDKLFVYPLPNIYHEDNKICWGNNDPSQKIKSLAGVEGLIRTFFSAPFNNDLFDTKKLGMSFPWKKVGNADRGYDVVRYFEFLSQNPFDRSWLRPLPSGGATDFATLIKKVGRQ